MRVDLFDFDLPPALIAQRPAVPRDSARLLRVTGAGLSDRLVSDLPSLIEPGDLLVFNDTRVVPARLIGERRGIRVSVTLHRMDADDSWWAFAKPGKRLRPGDRVDFGPDFSAEIRDKAEDGTILLKFGCAGADLRAALGRHGQMPLPPYIRGGTSDARDHSDYQTIFAAREGAVAAPTAALHFTPSLMSVLAARGVTVTFVTLHVGAGTFLPVRVEDTRDHRMHAEWGEVSEAAAAAVTAARQRGNKVIAIGTTSLRLLETAGRSGSIYPFAGTTDLFVTPGYRFRIADRLLTNFHLPRSTLFMLVAAFSGIERMKAAYRHAVEQRYRFYSYGDCCLLDPAPERP